MCLQFYSPRQRLTIVHIVHKYVCLNSYCVYFFLLTWLFSSYLIQLCFRVDISELEIENVNEMYVELFLLAINMHREITQMSFSEIGAKQSTSLYSKKHGNSSILLVTYFPSRKI